MTEAPSPRPMRQDAGRNRDALISAARRHFAANGPDVPLEEIAHSAGVSRTTLFRHFKTRESLAATILEANLKEIEDEAHRLEGSPGGVRSLFDFVFDLQTRDQGFAHLLRGRDLDWFTDLSDRTAAAFAPLVTAGHSQGIIHPNVDVLDFLIAFPMASGVHSDAEAWGKAEAVERVRAMLHRALFMNQEP